MNHRDRQIQKQFKQRFYHYTAADSANGTNSGSKKANQKRNQHLFSSRNYPVIIFQIPLKK